MKIFYVGVIFAILLSFSQISAANQSLDRAFPPPLEQAPSPPGELHPFELSAVKIGDKVAKMKILSIEPFDPKNPISENNVVIKFEGAVTFIGIYKFFKSIDGLHETNCIIPVQLLSQYELPQLKSDKRLQRFCFTNEKFSSSLLSGSENNGHDGIAEVQINNLTYISHPGKKFNSATLVSVFEKAKIPAAE